MSSSENAPSERVLRLQEFLKIRGLVDTGGEAKVRIQGGEVAVNGEVETRRGRQLVTGDVVTFDGTDHAVGEDAEAT
ncbi:MAG: RNA-binding S4 domain-containing protein [Planctomycetes bacterium]|nr:RNA-binding S4 domain-containing protein [Planctomycetota bacterium]